MHRVKLQSLAAVTAIAALGLAVAPAHGDGGAKTQIEITKLSADGASGTLTSGASKCEGSGRRVQFFKLDGYISEKLQKTMTTSTGRWKIERDLEPGRYFAKVDSISGCRYDNSKFETLR